VEAENSGFFADLRHMRMNGGGIKSEIFSPDLAVPGLLSAA
jgi:hypothetical protein